MPTPVVAVVACGAPPVSALPDLLHRLRDRDWDVYAFLTARAAQWIDPARIDRLAGHRVRTALREPTEPKGVPLPDLVVVAPATFNTVNQWAAGINDTAPLGLLNEALGAGVPIVVAPNVKGALAHHPAYGRSIDLLRGAGVRFTAPDALGPGPDGYAWPPVLELIDEVLRPLRTPPWSER
ncbi:flavoprotein [Hamadaea tsunoensis]|uniref:flavoprotein n=1 Tax=Hamadaea tsunoensis TaxID=53368 RepID=UPI0009FD8757|nr:flavoprotein [Hamadaea tsunoensis]